MIKYIQENFHSVFLFNFHFNTGIEILIGKGLFWQEEHKIFFSDTDMRFVG